jgi:hypothetical protein
MKFGKMRNLVMNTYMLSGAVRSLSFSLPYVPRLQEHVVQTLVCRMSRRL